MMDLKGLMNGGTNVLTIITIILFWSSGDSKAQQIISTPCTTSMVSSFTPCINFITGSSSNGTSTSSPAAGCCDAFKELVGASMDCACLVVMANVPIQLPFVPPISISLPRACKLGVPLRCRASVSPLPAPGPALLRTSDAPAPTPQSSTAVADSPASAPDVMATRPEEENPTTAISGRPFLSTTSASVVLSHDVPYYAAPLFFIAVAILLATH